ncbi:hypothetical protein DEU56DRAFT_566733 [Suillus clintonianus]|uniref:uncharacterized protein n=1 Tax=Suillus clintonianus TaxID=1904413 RepID=UPI001B867640|nr:uncharacterized protein DEU56DRAFT_566733 [Suillus clintonianus]KAG2125685.1 hypothetical protein DEU56DRAFT_566733 [Suillus clintonianus]
MSINIEHQNQTKASGVSITADLKGKGKEKEIDLPANENASDASDAAESEYDKLGNYPLERFPSPPSDEPNAAPTTTPHAATQNLNTPSLDPPLMKFIYPPPSPLCDDPTWFAQMVADVHRNRNHLITQLELARAEAAAALADVTLAQLELQAETDGMQKLLDDVAAVAGPNVVNKLIKSVQSALKNDDEDPEDLQDADDENSSGDGDEHEVDLHDAQDENLSAGESEDDLQDAEDDRSDGNLWSRATDNNSDYPRCFRHEDSIDGSDAESPFAYDSRELALEWHLNEPSNPDNVSGWFESSPTNGRNKRRLEDEEEEELSPLSYFRKKVKVDEGEAGETESEVSIPQYDSAREKTQSEIDSEEEYEVENLTLEIDPELLSRPLCRDPFRLRQNSGGEPELYIPEN